MVMYKMDKWKNNENKQWKKPNLDSLWTPFAQILGGCTATSLLKIWDVIPSLPEDTVRAKTEIWYLWPFLPSTTPYNCGILEPQNLTFPRLQCHYQSGY